MTDDQLWWASFGVAVAGALFVLFDVLIMGALMLGTAAIGCGVLRRRHRIDERHIREIEDYANRREDR